MNIIQNIYSIIAVGALIILNAVAIAKGVTTIVKSVRDAKSATEEEKQAAKDAIIKNLQQVIFGWVTDAEKDLGGGTGKLKASKVAAMIYQYIPDDLKPMFTPEEIQGMIDTALAAAKEYWEKNGKAKEYIESGATVMLTAEVDAAKAADGIPVEEVVKAVGAGVSEAIKTAMEAAKATDTEATVEVKTETEIETTAETKEE